MYNGTEEAPEREDMKLSDAFEVPSEGYEWTAHLINVNSGHNDEIMDNCPALKGYAFFIQEIRNKKAEGLSINEAVDLAIKKTIEAGYLVDYLGKIQREAKTMILTEFDAKAYEEEIREEAREEGREEGRAEEHLNTMAEKKRADEEKARAEKAEAELAKYKAKFGVDL